MKKINFKIVLTLAIVAMATIACNGKKSEKEEQVDMHNSEISLDWAGSYSGVVPCADCEGISTELTLTQDGTYTLTSEYLGKESLVTTKEGTFSWDETGSIVKLDGIEEGTGSALFKVEENRVRWLDLEGNVIEGELADHYVLKKDGNLMVENLRWELVEIYGKEINGSADTHYLIFHSATGMVEAMANCNVIQAGYKIKDELRVQFTEGPMTLKACPEDETVEKELLQVLAEADNLSTDGENLSLNKARMAPLAIFKLVK